MLGALHQVEVDGNRRITTVRKQLHVVRLGKVSREGASGLWAAKKREGSSGATFAEGNS